MTTGRRVLARAAATGFVGLGAARAWRRLRRRRGDHRVFVLEYHDVGPDGPVEEGIVSVSRFRAHVRWLRRHYPIVSLSEAVAQLARPGGLAEDVVVITLDDGYAGTFEHAWPVLRGEGVPGAVFLTTGFLDGEPLWFDVARRCLGAARRAGIDAWGVARKHGRDESRPPRDLIAWMKRLPTTRRRALLADLEAELPALAPARRALTWAQVRTIRGDIEIGAHTLTHPILAASNVTEQRREIEGSRARIAECTGTSPSLFAYPNGAVGDFDESTIACVREAGFVAACTTTRGSNRAGCDRFRLRRLGVGEEPCLMLAARLAGLFDEPQERADMVGLPRAGGVRMGTGAA